MNFFSQIASFCVGNDEKSITDDAKGGTESEGASAPALSAEQVAQCRKAFNDADENNDGFLSRTELCQICGWAESDTEVANFLAEFDIDKNGKIDFNEFCIIMAQALLKDEESEAAAGQQGGAAGQQGATAEGP